MRLKKSIIISLQKMSLWILYITPILFNTWNKIFKSSSFPLDKGLLKMLYLAMDIKKTG
jgi:hypothetical protein